MSAIITTSDSAPITLAYLEALLAPTEIVVQEPPPAELVIQEPPCADHPSVVVTDEDWLSAIKVVSWLIGKKAQAATAEYAQTELRQRLALAARVAEQEQFMARLLDLSHPGTEPKGGFAKLKAQPAKKVASELFNTLLYMNERIAERLHDD